MRLPAGNSTHINAMTPFGDAGVNIRTPYETYGAGAVPRGLWVEVMGKAPRLATARDTFQQIAEGISTRISLTMNAAIERLTPTVAFDMSPERADHDYWQFVIDAEGGLPRPARLLDNLALELVGGALEVHPHRDSLERATGQYREAMLHIIPGQWLLAVAHAWMGFEALKTVALERELARLYCTPAQLGAKWGVKTSQLENEARLRLLFAAASGLHDRARDTSNDLEHALVGFGPLQQLAQRDAMALVSRLRRGILRNLLGRIPRQVSQNSNTPFPCAPLQQFIEAELHGSAGNLAPIDLQYPNFEFRQQPTDVTFNNDGTYTMTHNATITARLGAGITATTIRHQVWGAPGTKRK